LLHRAMFPRLSGRAMQWGATGFLLFANYRLPCLKSV